MSAIRERHSSDGKLEIISFQSAVIGKVINPSHNFDNRELKIASSSGERADGRPSWSPSLTRRFGVLVVPLRISESISWQVEGLKDRSRLKEQS
jgi:hypothetical protein